MRNLSQRLKLKAGRYDWKASLPFLDPSAGILAMARPWPSKLSEPGYPSLHWRREKSSKRLHNNFDVPHYNSGQYHNLYPRVELGHTDGPIPSEFPSYNDYLIWNAGSNISSAISSLLVSKPFLVPANKKVWFGMTLQVAFNCGITSMSVVKKSEWDAISASDRAKCAILSATGENYTGVDGGGGSVTTALPGDYWRESLARFLPDDPAPASLMGMAIKRNHATQIYGTRRYAQINGNGGTANYTWNPYPEFFNENSVGSESGRLCSIGAVINFANHSFDTGDRRFAAEGGTADIFSTPVNVTIPSGSTFTWNEGDEFVILFEFNHQALFDNELFGGPMRLFTAISRMSFIGWEDPMICDPTYASPLLLGPKQYITNGGYGGAAEKRRAAMLPEGNESLGSPSNYSSADTPTIRNFLKSGVYWLPRPSAKAYFECLGFIKEGGSSPISGHRRVGVLFDPSIGSFGRVTYLQDGQSFIANTLNNSMPSLYTLLTPANLYKLSQRVFLDPSEWEFPPVGVVPWLTYPPKSQNVIFEDDFKGAFMAPRRVKTNYLPKGKTWESGFGQDLTILPLEAGGGLKVWTGAPDNADILAGWRDQKSISIDLGEHINSFTMEVVASLRNAALVGTFYLDLYVGNNNLEASRFNGDFLEFTAGGSYPAGKMSTYGVDPGAGGNLQPTPYKDYVVGDDSFHKYKFEYTKDGYKRLYFDDVLVFEATWVGFSWQGTGTEGTFAQLDINAGFSTTGPGGGNTEFVIKSVKISA